jgi:A/G-specific adenine glycosylase
MAKVTTSRRPARKLLAGSAAAPPSADIEDLATSAALVGPASAPAALRSGLLRWYDAHRRDLPWRFSAAPGREGREKRAYAVWVSEVMLQQTRVPVVIDYYSRWMERWPTVETLAAATQEVKPGDRDSCARKIQSLIHTLPVEIEFLIR